MKKQWKNQASFPSLSMVSPVHCWSFFPRWFVVPTAIAAHWSRYVSALTLPTSVPPAFERDQAAGGQVLHVFWKTWEIWEKCLQFTTYLFSLKFILYEQYHQHHYPKDIPNIYLSQCYYRFLYYIFFKGPWSSNFFQAPAKVRGMTED